MTAELPAGAAIEPVFLIEATYAPDAADRRPRYRMEHLERIAALRNAGTVIEAGGCADFSDAYLLVRVADADEALALYTSDVYTRGGVWTGVRVRAFGRVCRPEEIGRPG